MDHAGRVFEGKRVFVTGHTGFKGSWLCEWLLLLGADVHGYSLSPPGTPALFEQLKLSERLHHETGDVRDADRLAAAIERADPEFVFHLAAQSLVRPSYTAPVETFAVNVMGTAHVLAALQGRTKPCVAIVVTSDKCYENHEAGRRFAESDPLGGKDPYSASKAAAELVVTAWRTSFFSPNRIVAGEVAPVALASVRAGNVMGGGDWAVDRIVPDCIRALSREETIQVRNPGAVRPWQHVLDPLSGYLTLAAKLSDALRERSPDLSELCSAFNFGPAAHDHRTVGVLVDEVLKYWPGRWEQPVRETEILGEAGRLNLNIEKARQRLNWSPRWDFATAVKETVAWYRRPAAEVAETTRAQIAAYVAKGSA